MNFLTMRASASHNVVVPRFWRINLFDRLIMPCCLPAWPAFTLPEAVNLKRFLALDLVFILGICVSFQKYRTPKKYIQRKSKAPQYGMKTTIERSFSLCNSHGMPCQSVDETHYSSVSIICKEKNQNGSDVPALPNLAR